MLPILARSASYFALGFISLLLSVMTFTCFGIGGALLGSLFLSLLSVFMPQLGPAGAQAGSSLVMGGAIMLGGGGGLLLLGRLWIAFAQESHDPVLCELGHTLDELSRAMRRSR